MRGTNLAFKENDDEVPVVSQELLEEKVTAIRVDLNELKTDFRAAVARLDQRVDAAVAKLEGEIRTAAAKAERELRQFADRIEKQIAEMRADDKALRERIDRNHESTTAQITELSKSVNSLNARFNALFWFLGAVVAPGGVIYKVGKDLHWF
jgi:DNA repair exonuclease SbcCD ATPase subunit